MRAAKRSYYRVARAVKYAVGDFLVAVGVLVPAYAYAYAKVSK